MGGLQETDEETCFLENTNPKGALQHVSPALIIPQPLFSLSAALTYSAALRVDNGKKKRTTPSHNISILLQVLSQTFLGLLCEAHWDKSNALDFLELLK